MSKYELLSLTHLCTYLNSVFGQLGCHIHGGPHPAIIPLPGVRVKGETEIDDLQAAIERGANDGGENGGSRKVEPVLCT